jgi:FMN-dependent NADH-azoreductase
LFGDQDPNGLDAVAFRESEVLTQELEQADGVVIATPMHNYGVPAVLKAWVDQVVRIHRSFVSTPAGKVGRLRDRPVILVVASGGWFTCPSPTGAPPQPDFLTPYLRAILTTIGLRNIHVLALEGVTRGSEMLDQALTRARRSLDLALSDPVGR